MPPVSVWEYNCSEKSSPAQGKAKALKTRSASATNGTLADGPKQNKGGPITSMRNFFGRIFASKPPANPPSQSATTLDAATTAVSTATSAATSTVAQAELPKTDSIPTVETESVPFNNLRPSGTSGASGNYRSAIMIRQLLSLDVHRSYSTNTEY